MTVKQFLLKKFPTKDYFDCPISKEHWETIQEFADQETEGLKIELAAQRGISESRLEDMDLLRYEVEVLQQQLENCKRKNYNPPQVGRKS